MTRYEGPLELGMVLTAPDNEGVLGLRRVRLVAKHIDGDWIIEDLPARMWRRFGPDRGPKRCPEINLRIVFVPEEVAA